MEESVNYEELASALASQKWIIIIPLILFLIFIFVFARAANKESKKRREQLHREISGYMQMGQPQTHTYSGSVSVSYDTVTYTRGNRSAIFNICINKKTILAPCLVDEWFKNRNYNGREANIILKDIERYLLDNKICKSVKIVDDDEYESLRNELYETDDD